jgi:hypothetical protein
MSRTHHFHIIVAAAGLLGSTLTAPAIVQAQSFNPSRALLNKSIVALSTRDPVVNWILGPALDPAAQSEGELALLGRRTAIPIRAVSSVSRAPVGGEVALLGREQEVE